jgi:hypothetical protein
MFSRRVVLSVLNVVTERRSGFYWSPWLRALSQRSVSSDHLDVGRLVSLQSDARCFVCFLFVFCFNVSFYFRSGG